MTVLAMGFVVNIQVRIDFAGVMPKHFYNLRGVLVDVVGTQAVLLAEMHSFSQPLTAAASPKNDDVTPLLFAPKRMK